MKIKAFNVRLPENVIKKLKDYSKATGIKIQKLVADAIESFVNKNP